MKLSSDNYNKVYNLIKSLIEARKVKGFVPTDKNLMPIIEQALSLSCLEYDEDDKEKLYVDFEYSERIIHTPGECIFDNYDTPDWYFNENVEDSYFWDRYYRYLTTSSSIDSKSIDLLHNETLPNIMNCLFDPKEQVEGKRLNRGLIIGDVQSGKTATYTGLICKAADAGYKVVILLAGITESLRQQTQERIDEGVVGYTIRKVGKKEVSGRIGVGTDNKDLHATSFTTCVKDFVQGSNLISTTLSAHNSLVIFVVKKNVSVLTKLHDWLKSQNMDPVTQSINHPMLLIDDEADNASVNTKNDQTNPTRTNAIIRQICNLFQTANYVGFTATPFANVFIDPDSVDKMKNADLFPEHFIYTLPIPSSYIGAGKLFYDGGVYHGNLRYITDIEEPDYTSDEYTEDYRENVEELNSGPFYSRHTKEWNGTLPDSLRESIYCFYLANVIRDLRGHKPKPRSMLINMSRFVKVQRVILGHVEEIQKAYINKIRFDFDEDRKKNVNLPLYVELKRLWQKHFSCVTDVTFEQVVDKKNLLGAVYDVDSGNTKIKTIVVNGSSKTKLDYKMEPSLRVIAIGGLALSRGLTLEGLLVSYFYRNTATFDVLMQMGRWFGYRPGYDDIFQVWASHVSATWYAEVAKAADELKADLKGMYDQRLTPKDFGIKVRDCCDDLQITASNKMRKSYDLLVTESFYGTIYDTPYLSIRAEQNKKNRDSVIDFANLMYAEGYKLSFAALSRLGDADPNSDIDKSRYFADVPKKLIVDFLSRITCSKVNMRFNTSNLIDFIQDGETKGVEKWDVVFEGGDGTVYYDIPGLEKIRCPKRQIEEHDHVIQISTRRRILGFREGKFCLTKEEIEQAEQRCRAKWKIEDPSATEESLKKRSIPVRAYFENLPKRKPMLIIMQIQPTLVNEAGDEKAKKFIEELNGDRMIAFAVGFPGVHDNGKSKRYRVNKIYYRLNMQEPDETVDDEE